MEPKWFNVNVKARIWSGHSDDHQKQGTMYPPAAILAIDEYKGSYQFEEWKVVDEGIADFYAHEGYEQLWIRATDVTTLPFEDEDDVADEVWPVLELTRPSDETIGRVVRYLLGK